MIHTSRKITTHQCHNIVYPSLNSASDVAVIPGFNSGTVGFHQSHPPLFRSLSLSVSPSFQSRFWILLFPRAGRICAICPFLSSSRGIQQPNSRLVPHGSPLYKYHTLLSASRLASSIESRLRGPLRSVPRSRGPSALSCPLSGPHTLCHRVHLLSFIQTNHLQPLHSGRH